MKPQLPRPLFAVIRFLYAALAVADLVWIGLDHPRGEWIIHFGNWNRVVTALYFLLGSITAFHRSCCGSKESDHYNRIDDDNNQEYSFLDPSGSNSCALRPGEKDVSIAARTNRLSWHHEVLWVLHTLASNSSFVCLIAYFTFFFQRALYLHWGVGLSSPRSLSYSDDLRYLGQSHSRKAVALHVRLHIRCQLRRFHHNLHFNWNQGQLKSWSCSVPVAGDWWPASDPYSLSINIFDRWISLGTNIFLSHL